MSGNDRRAIVVQERDRHLLRELSILRVVDREQAKIVAGFHSTTRANSRLLALTRAGFLRRFFLGTSGGGQKALYALSSEGARIVDVPYRGPRRRQDEVLVADLFVAHQLSINEIHCTLKYQPTPNASRCSKVSHSFPMVTLRCSILATLSPHFSKSISEAKAEGFGRKRLRNISGTPSQVFLIASSDGNGFEFS